MERIKPDGFRGSLVATLNISIFAGHQFLSRLKVRRSLSSGNISDNVSPIKDIAEQLKEKEAKEQEEQAGEQLEQAMAKLVLEKEATRLRSKVEELEQELAKKTGEQQQEEQELQRRAGQQMGQEIEEEEEVARKVGELKAELHTARGELVLRGALLEEAARAREELETR